MKIHEYQAKEIFRRYNIPVPVGSAACSQEEIAEVAKNVIAQTGIDTLVIKAQIHAGGRGKGKFKNNQNLGGVKVLRGVEEIKKTGMEMLGNVLVTHQTGPSGQKVNKVLIEQGLHIKHEYYLGLVIDRQKEKIVIMASSEGGVEIEEVAAKSPEKILKEWIDPAAGIQPYQARNLGFGLGLGKNEVQKFTQFVMALSELFIKEDASLAEINPLVLTEAGEIIALDAKLNLDDNGAFRHKQWEALEDFSQQDPIEVEAKKAEVNYIKLNGSIGCLVNGAGLAMATMDIIKYYGGEPANFLDVGGGASKEMVTTAFKIILSDPAVKVIFVNIFGGIMKCDTIAEGIIAAVKELGLKVPLVVRLQGTNVEIGRKLLFESALSLIPVETMAEGAQKAVEIVKKEAAK